MFFLIYNTWKYIFNLLFPLSVDGLDSFAHSYSDILTDSVDFEAESWSLTVEHKFSKKQDKRVAKRQDVIYGTASSVSVTTHSFSFRTTYLDQYHLNPSLQSWCRRSSTTCRLCTSWRRFSGEAWRRTCSWMLTPWSGSSPVWTSCSPSTTPSLAPWRNAGTARASGRNTGTTWSTKSETFCSNR